MAAQEETTPQSQYINRLKAKVDDQAARIKVLETTPQSRYINKLHTKIDDQNCLIKVLRAKILHLETVLAQRIRLTKNKYEEKKKDLENQTDRCYEVLLRNPATHFTYQEFDEEFAVHFPDIRGHQGRRLRELFNQDRAWKDYDENGKVRFWLRLEKIE